MDKLIIPVAKPRARRLHEVLAGRAGGRMKSPRDYNRQQEKLATRQAPIHDNR
jgi:hypothetical protein